MKVKAFLLFLITIVLFSSCKAQKELHERLLVEGIGIDFEDSKFKVTLQFFDADFTTKEDEDEIQTVQVSGDSILDCLNKINLIKGEKLLYSHNFILLLGEEAVKNDINNITDFFTRHYEIRPDVPTFVIKNSKASEAMKIKINNEPIKPTEIADIGKSDFLNAKEIGSNILNLVKNIQNETSDPKLIALNLEKTENNNTLKSDGLAVFSENKLAGYLDLEESAGFLVTRNILKNYTQVIEIPEIGKVSYNINSSDRKINVNIKNNLPEFNIFIDIKFSIYEIDNKNSAINKDFFNILEENLNKKLKENVIKTIDKTVKNYQSDIFNFGQVLSKNNNDYYKKIKFNWKNILQNSEFNVRINSKIGRVCT